MKYKALYRETRPEVFDEILGQDSIVKILRNQVATNTVSHAYLFTGTRGTGKTTTARVLAKALNCEASDVSERPCGKCDNCKAIAEGTFVDVIEIDAASNNGVDNIRELRESVNYPPAIGRAKVYIIDEVHMLSSGAFNALLKTLEEPPENVVFVLATTNPEKLPQTVLSRCMRLDFKRVSNAVLRYHMNEICEKRGIHIEKEALDLLATNADGSVRDSLSILEQCISAGDKELTRDSVLDFLGAVSDEFYIKLTDNVAKGDVSSALVLLDQALSDGRDVKQLMKDWMGHYRSLLIAKYVKTPESLINMSAENLALISKQASGISLGSINRAISIIAKAIDDARYSTQARVLMEVAIVDIAGAPVVQISEPSKAQTAEQVTTPSPEPVPDYSESKLNAVLSVQKEPAPSHTYHASVPEFEMPATASAVTPATGSAVDSMEDAPMPSQSDHDAVPEPDEPASVPESDEPATRSAVVPATESGDIADVWPDICSEASEKYPFLNMMSDCQVEGPKDGEVKVLCELEMQKDFIERSSSYINELLEKHGVDAHIVCKLSGSSGNDGSNHAGTDDTNGEIDEKIRRAQKEAEELLGIEVTIK